MGTLKHITKVFFGRYLAVTNTLVSGCLMGAGDVAAQVIERGGNINIEQWDKQRTGRFFTFGILMGPMNHVWYSFLDKLLPVVTKRMVVKKIFLDQAIAGPLNIAALFIGLRCLERKPIKQGTDDFRSNFWNVYKMDLSIWPAAQLINFYWMPPELRMLYVCCVAFGWNTYLAYYRHEHVTLSNKDKTNKLTENKGTLKRSLTNKSKKVELSEQEERTILCRSKKIIEYIKV